MEHTDYALQAAEPSCVPRWDVTLSTNYYGGIGSSVIVQVFVYKH